MQDANSGPDGRGLRLKTGLPIAVFSVGMIGLGILALVYGDFALVWQPVPTWFPLRTALAYASGVVMLFGGLGLLSKAASKWSVRILFLYMIAWLLLKIPPLFLTPRIEGVWLGAGELVVLLTGGWVLIAETEKLSESSLLKFLTTDRSIGIARILFAISLVPIGLSHFVYPKATENLVPAWLPFRIGWAYLTGAGHIAAGLAVLFSILPRVAAVAEAGMLSIFTLLVWMPAIWHAPRTRLPWTAFFVSWAITSSAWLVASHMTSNRSAKPSAFGSTATGSVSFE